MNASVRCELLATFGAPQLGFYLLFLYLFSLGSSLLIGSAVHNSDALGLATALWATGDLAVVIGAGACMARFANSASELRIPDHTPMMRRNYALLCTLLLIVPIILFRSFIHDDWQLIWITLTMPLCLLWPRLAQVVRTCSPSHLATLTKTGRYPIRFPSDAIRVYFGNAYAPVPIASRVFKLRLSGVVLWSAPLILAGTDFIQPVRWLAPYYLGVTGGLVWVWLMTSLARFIVERSATFAELALLPGLGNPASQRRAYYVAALAPPMHACVFFATLALVWAWSTSHSFQAVGLLALVLSFLMLLSAQNIVGQLLVKRAAQTTKFKQVYLLSMQFWVAFLLLNRASDFGKRFPYIFLSSLVFLAIILLTITWRNARRFAQLPHPFLQ